MNDFYQGFNFDKVPFTRNGLINLELFFFSGMLCTLSSEASVLILFLITLDRYLSIMRPFAEKNRSMNVAYTICGSLWATSCLLAGVPLLGGCGILSGFCI